MIGQRERGGRREDGSRRDLDRGTKDNPLEVVAETPQHCSRGPGALESLEVGESKRQTGKEIGSPGKSRERERRRRRERAPGRGGRR